MTIQVLKIICNPICWLQNRIVHSCLRYTLLVSTVATVACTIPMILRSQVAVLFLTFYLIVYFNNVQNRQ